MKNFIKKLDFCYLSLSENLSRLQKKFAKHECCTCLIKADVKSFFPNIPQLVCIAELRKFLISNWDNNITVSKGLPLEVLMEIIDFLVFEPHIAIGRRSFKQIKEVLIGSPAALPIAEIFLYQCEDKAVSAGTLSRDNFHRYVDDYICIEKSYKVFEILMNCLAPLELLKEGEGMNVQFLNAEIYIEDGRLYTRYHMKASCTLPDFRSIMQRKTKVNTLKQMALNIKYVSDRDKDLVNSLTMLKSKAYEACYPKRVVDNVISEVINEDGPGDAYLWKDNWRVIKGIVEDNVGLEVVYLRRKWVPPDGWCLLYAICGKREADFFDDLFDKIETIAEESRFADFLGENFKSQFSDYRNQKSWNSGFTDILPFLISEVLGLSILILVFKEDGLSYVNFIRNSVHSVDAKSLKVIALKNGHYWKICCIFGKGGIDKFLKKCRYVRPTLVLPFVDPKTNGKVKQICSKFKLNGNVCFKALSLYNLTKGQTRKKVLDDSWKIPGVVYSMKCLLCKGEEVIYIGETGRSFKARHKEHLSCQRDRTRMSEVGAHGVEVHDSLVDTDWEAKLLYFEKDEFIRKAVESWFIYRLKPKLNVISGVNFVGIEFCDFIKK